MTTPLSPPLVALGLLLALAVAGLFTWLHVWFWVRRLSLALTYAVEKTVPTPDGSAIELRRIGVPAARRGVPPVLLVHGISANHRNQDLHPDYSLARFLAASGRDVWLLTLRSGRSNVPWRERRLQTFEAMVRFDLPVAVAEVLRETGERQLDLAVFSMGGMLLYAALGRTLPEASVRRVVVVGSPALVQPKVPLAKVLPVFPAFLLPRVPTRFFSRAIAFLSEWFTTPFHRLVINPLNLPAGLTRVALVDVIQDVPRALLKDFHRFASANGEIRVGGEAALQGLATISVPALFVAGAADHIAPVAAVKAGFAAWAAARPETPKRFVVLGCEYGHKFDYGHGDLVFGAHVGVELFEPIAKFLGPEQPETAGPETGAAAKQEIDERQPVRR